jgi:hypothetical protein
MKTIPRACMVLVVAVLFGPVSSGSEHITYGKIHFTDDGEPDGEPLVEDFVWHSCWWALGNNRAGNIYVAISNHLNYPGGNVAVFKYDPALDRMSFLNDLQSVSTAAGNWLATENQQKVHTRLIEGGDGRVYFATHDNSWGNLSDHRGTHFYAIENDQISDLSVNTTQYLDKDMQTVEGSIGVHVENYGTIGMEMAPGIPGIIYGITYGEGYLYQLKLGTGAIRMIARTGRGHNEGIIRNLAVDLDGNAYVPVRGATNGEIRIFKYDNAQDSWGDTGKSYMDGFLAVKDSDKSGWLLHVYPKARDMAYFIAYDGKVYRFTFETGLLEYLGILEANPNPRVNNLILSDDGKRLYALVYRYGGTSENKFVEFDLETGLARTIESRIALYGTRDLIFGGFAKDRLGHAYMVGWTFAVTTIGNIALFKIGVEPPPTLAIRPKGLQLELDWTHGLLQVADDLGGPWSEDATAFPPFMVDPEPPGKFYRLRYGSPGKSDGVP